MSGAGAVPLRPTAALTRGGVIGLLALLAAMATGRSALLVLALPLVAWTILAVLEHARRPLAEAPADPADFDAAPGAARSAAPDAAPVRVRLRRTTIPEQGTTAVDVSAAPHLLLGTTWPLRAGLRTSPPRAASATTGTARLRVTASRWGRYELGPVHVVLTDAAGAYRWDGPVTCPPLSVVPDAPSLEAPLEVPQSLGMSGPHLSRRRGDGTALADVRPFVTGDRLARVNWRVTARTGRMHTNATFTEQDTDVLIVTDTLQDVAPLAPTRGSARRRSAGTDPAAAEAPLSSLDVTIRATAAISRHYLGAGDRVAVHDAGTLIGDVRLGTGPRQVRRIVTALARAQRTGRGLGRPRPLRGLRTGTLVVVCSPLLDAQIIRLIGDALAQGGEVIVIDTLPVRLGDVAALGTRRRGGPTGGDERFWEEAWVLRRLIRDRVVRDLRERGVPVTAWTGPGSLAPVLLSLSAAATAPRMRRA